MIKDTLEIRNKQMTPSDTRLVNEVLTDTYASITRIGRIEKELSETINKADMIIHEYLYEQAEARPGLGRLNFDGTYLSGIEDVRDELDSFEQRQQKERDSIDKSNVTFESVRRSISEEEQADATTHNNDYVPDFIAVRMRRMTSMHLHDNEVKMFKNALEFLYDKIPKATKSENLTIETVEMRPAFVSFHSIHSEMRTSFRALNHGPAHGTKYELAKQRIDIQPFCTRNQLDFIILHWVKDRKNTITLQEMEDPTLAGDWISAHESEKKRKQRERTMENRRAVRFAEEAQRPRPPDLP